MRTLRSIFCIAVSVLFRKKYKRTTLEIKYDNYGKMLFIFRNSEQDSKNYLLVVCLSTPTGITVFPKHLLYHVCLIQHHIQKEAVALSSI